MHLNTQVALHFLSAHAGACIWYNIVQLGASSSSLSTVTFVLGLLNANMCLKRQALCNVLLSHDI